MCHYIYETVKGYCDIGDGVIVADGHTKAGVFGKITRIKPNIRKKPGDKQIHLCYIDGCKTGIPSINLIKTEQMTEKELKVLTKDPEAFAKFCVDARSYPKPKSKKRKKKDDAQEIIDFDEVIEYSKNKNFATIALDVRRVLH